MAGLKRATSKGQLVDMAAVKIGEQYKLGQTKIVGSVKHLLKCGAMLIGKKAEFKHGEWGKWLEANVSVLGFSRKTAERMMKAAGKNDVDVEIEGEAALEINRMLWGNEEPKKKKSSSRASARKDPPNYSSAVTEVIDDAYWTVDCDAADILEADWQPSTWLNPPAGSAGLFMDKLCREISEGRVSKAIALVPNKTESQWFQDAAIFASAFCFPTGQKLALCYFGSEQDKFHNAFDSVGVVLRRR